MRSELGREVIGTGMRLLVGLGLMLLGAAVVLTGPFWFVAFALYCIRKAAHDLGDGVVSDVCGWWRGDE